jgi:hypothetical protein
MRPSVRRNDAALAFQPDFAFYSEVRLLALGLSYTARRFARLYPEAQVSVLSRDPAAVAAAGFRNYRPGEPVDAALDCVPAIEAHAGIADPPYCSELDELFGRAGSLPFVHISSTSVLPPGSAAERVEDLPVYDETCAPAPAERRGELRLALEERMRRLYPHVRILRSAGIYGPGRSVPERFQRGDFSRADSGNNVVSRIHADDLARLAHALLQYAGDDVAAPRLVHGVDELPTANAEIFLFLEQELGVVIPGAWRSARPFGRRVTSRHARALLEGRYAYPTYREGFRALLQGRDADG